MDQVIVTEKLGKDYQQGEIVVPALVDVSLTISRGEFTTIVGPSGSGKTTFLNMIGGLDIPTSGNIILGGEPLSTMKQKQLADFRRDNIGFIFQSYNLIPVLTAIENIEYVMVIQGIPKQERHDRVEAILEDVGLTGLGDRLPNQLSGGQQQRVAIARSMVAQPQIILADEPTANVDSHTGADLIHLMLKLNEEKNMTFIFSTHDPMVMEQAHRIIHLHDGKIEDDERNP